MAGIIINEINVKADVDIITQDDGQVMVSAARYHSVYLNVTLFGADSSATAAAFVEGALRQAMQALEDSAEVSTDDVEQG